MTIEEAKAKIAEAEEEITRIIKALPLPVHAIDIETDGTDVWASLDVRL